MIKLNKPLPTTITVEGREFLVKTDFRYWLMFDEIIKRDKVQLSDLFFLFEDEIPQCDFSQELIDFYTNPNSTPNVNKESNDIVLDYQEDGEFIYASFLQAYGIDLFEVNLHWHKFKALILGLPDDTKMAQIMGMRGWKKDNRSFEKMQAENKKAWSFPKKYDKETLEEIQKAFGG